MPWDCPDCGRRFRRKGQGHECAPAMSVEEYFETGPAFERPIFDAVMAHLDTVGDVFVEPVSVGIFLKRSQNFAQLRTMTKWVALCLFLPREVRDPRIARKVVRAGRDRWYHVVNVRGPDDLDDTVKGWLTEAWEHCPAD